MIARRRTGESRQRGDRHVSAGDADPDLDARAGVPLVPSGHGRRRPAHRACAVQQGALTRSTVAARDTWSRESARVRRPGMALCRGIMHIERRCRWRGRRRVAPRCRAMSSAGAERNRVLPLTTLLLRSVTQPNRSCVAICQTQWTWIVRKRKRRRASSAEFCSFSSWTERPGIDRLSGERFHAPTHWMCECMEAVKTRASRPTRCTRGVHMQKLCVAGS